MASVHPAVRSRAARPAVRGRSAASPAFPLRDWKRAFALVDRLKAEYRTKPWFRGIRAFWDAHRDEIRIEVEVFWTAAQAAVPADLSDLAIHFRQVAPANAR